MESFCFHPWNLIKLYSVAEYPRLCWGTRPKYSESGHFVLLEPYYSCVFFSRSHVKSRLWRRNLWRHVRTVINLVTNYSVSPERRKVLHKTRENSLYRWDKLQDLFIVILDFCVCSSFTRFWLASPTSFCQSLFSFW